MTIFLLMSVGWGQEVEWSQTYGEGYGVTTFRTSDNGYVILGDTYNPDTDFVLIKTDSNGDELWRNVYGGSENDWISYGEETNDDGIIIQTLKYKQFRFEIYRSSFCFLF